MNQKFQQKTYYAIKNVDLMKKNVIQINGETTANVYFDHIHPFNWSSLSSI